MSNWLRSPGTTLAGLGAGLGLLVMLMGLAFDEDEVWKTGMGIVGAAAALIGILARSEGQHEADKPVLKAEVAKDIKEEMREEARDVARDEAQQTVQKLNR
jgi:hypothetical protein